MEIGEVRKLTDRRWTTVKEAKQDLWQARFALSTRQLKDYGQIPGDQTDHHPGSSPSSASAPPRLAWPSRSVGMPTAGATTVKGQRKTKVAASSATRWTRPSSCPSSD